jgi:Na+/melibiose symporter-like transporter
VSTRHSNDYNAVPPPTSRGPRGFGAAASGFFWVVLPSMLADVVDFDELEGGKRRDGALGSTLSYSYVLKLGTTVTLLAALALRRYPLTRATMNDIRARLEDRRGEI